VFGEVSFIFRFVGHRLGSCRSICSDEKYAF